VARPGKPIKIQGRSGNANVQMYEVTKLGRDKLYVFPFKHM